MAGSVERAFFVRWRDGAVTLLEPFTVALLLSGDSLDGSRFRLRNEFFREDGQPAARVTSTGGVDGPPDAPLDGPSGGAPDSGGRIAAERGLRGSGFQERLLTARDRPTVRAVRSR